MPPRRARQWSRAGRGRATSVVGAAGAQFSQAAGSVAVSVLAMRQSDVHLFSTLSLLLGALVVATSISTGLVGDTLTVLDRQDDAIRTALRRLLLLVIGAAAPLSAAAAWGSGLVGGSDGWLFGGLVAAWVTEDVLRRLLMACLRFWHVVAVDLAHLATVVSVLWAVAATTGHPPDLSRYLVALSCGQVVASALAVLGLPGSERYRGPAVPGRFGTVLRYGLHRASQGLLRPATLLLMRVAVMAGCGSSALALLETGRIVTSPALLLVSGGGAYLLSRYAATTRADDGSGRADADRAALLLAAVTVAATIAVLAGVLAVPQALGGSVAGISAWSLTALIVAWGGYVLAVAVAMPYASLGAVRVAQARLLRARLLDTVLQVAAGAAVMLFAGSRWLCLPAVAGAVSAAVTLAVLRPLVADATGPGTAAVPATAAVTGAEPLSAG